MMSVYWWAVRHYRQRCISRNKTVCSHPPTAFGACSPSSFSRTRERLHSEIEYLFQGLSAGAMAASGDSLAASSASASAGSDVHEDYFIPAKSYDSSDYRAGPISKLVGDSVFDAERTRKRTVELEGPGRVVGLYFSAYWCPPCRAFTPDLIKWWKNVTEEDKKVISIILCCSDPDVKIYRTYAAALPAGMYHIPWECGKVTQTVEKIARKYGVSGIPVLLLLDAVTGEIINPNGRGLVLSDPKARNMSWKPINLCKVLLEKDYILAPKKALENPSEYQHQRVLGTTLRNKIIGIYFASTYCPPCSIFTPILRDLHKATKRAGKPFEVVFCTAEDSEELFIKEFHSVPWLALPHSDIRRTVLAQYFHVEGIPQLIILDKNFRVITTEGHVTILNDPKGHDYPWKEKEVNELTERYSSTINDVECLIWMTDGTPSQCRDAKEVLLSVARPFFDAQDKPGVIKRDLLFFYGGVEYGMTSNMLNYLNLKEDEVKFPFIFFLNIFGQRVYHFDKPIRNKANLEDFLESVYAEEAPYERIF